ncbi:glycosyltransferase family 39 protein [uncultured Croceitalea sp.]|uniref:glycosyltransferase family 39 protein n=1 Tax=uncultured Croceitalea sp. TaxID=1798908 RepID=UPI00374FB885
MLQKNLGFNKVGILALLSFLAITCITFFKSAMELEDAEQAYFSQWLRWGYDDQPPLYTWLQYAVNSVFGVSKFSFSVLRGIIFATILLMLFALAKKLALNRIKAELSVLSLVLVPVFIDFTFRRLSHTTLLCLVILSTYLIIQNLINKKTIWNYMLFGAIIGIGILSKYNYVLFLGAFFLAAFLDLSIRKIILHPLIMVTLIVSALVVMPHFYWLLGPQGYLETLEQSVALKLESNLEKETLFLTPIYSYIKSIFRLVSVLVITLAPFFLLKKIKFVKQKVGWLTKLFLAQLIVLLFFFLILNVQKVEVRWLLPLFLPFSILLISNIHFKSVEKWSKYGFMIFLTMIFIQVVRTPIEKLLHIPSSIHFGFNPIANKLKENYSDKLWVLPNVTYGGNIRLLYPEREIFSKDDFSIPKSKIPKNTVEVIFEDDVMPYKIIRDSIGSFGKEKENLFFLVN